MCYSPEVSFGIWGFGLLVSAYLYYTKKPFLFPFVVSQMQLVEGLRWIHAVDERILAIAGKLVLYAQPVAAFYEAGKYTFILPYLIIQIATELLYGSRDLRFVRAEDGHFEWKWNFDPISLQALPYWIGLLLGASYILPTEISTLMILLFVYFYTHHSKYNTYGSLWCVSVNVLLLYYLYK